MSRRAAPAGAAVATAMLAALAACTACTTSPAPAPAPPEHALGMNDVSILLPLPADPSAPVLSAVSPLVPTDWFQSFVITSDDLGPKNGGGFSIAQCQVVSLRFDVCDRSTVGPCPPGADGRLRLIVQPVQAANGSATTADVAVHLFYPIPAADLPGVVSELRALAAIQDAPAGAPLEVSPALAAGDAEYLARLTALVETYAQPANLVRMTVAGQVSNSAPFEWHFRQVDRDGDQFTPTLIPQVNEYEQIAQVADGDVTYQTPELDVADAPVGFALAIEGLYWSQASTADHQLALGALAQVMNPTLFDTVNTQCLSCHVATYLSSYRGSEMGVDPTTLPSWYRSPRNLDTGALANSTPFEIRNFGYVDDVPIASQRIANDTAHALDDFDRLYPAR